LNRILINRGWICAALALSENRRRLQEAECTTRFQFITIFFETALEKNFVGQFGEVKNENTNWNRESVPNSNRGPMF
jgi:hypothetical protein